jgi:regulator of replication initiation timing
MKSVLIAFGTGLVIGAGAVYVAGGLRSLEVELAGAKRELKQAVERSDQLAVELKAAKEVTAGGAALEGVDPRLGASASVSPPADRPGANRGGRRGAFGGFMDMGREARLEALKQRLNLTPEQIAKIEEESERQRAAREKLRERMANGEQVSPEEWRAIGNMDSILDPLLTDDQKKKYEAFREQESQGQQEMMANVELSQIGPLLQLDDAQKDKVFDALYNHSVQAAMRRGIEEGADISATVDTILQQRLEAVRPILSEQQMAIYGKHLESQRRSMERMVSRGARGGGPPP